LEYTTNTMKYIINTSKCIKKNSNILVSFRIHLFIIKNTLLCFNIHTYTSQIHNNTFQIHSNTFQKPYILFIYITIPLLYSNILPHTSIYVETVMRLLCSTPFCLVTNTIFQNCLGASLFYQDVNGMPWHLCWNLKLKQIPRIPYILLVN
jgi:hypothetical protein